MTRRCAWAGDGKLPFVRYVVNQLCYWSHSKSGARAAPLSRCVSREPWWRHQKFIWLSTSSYHVLHVYQISFQPDIVLWPKCRWQTFVFKILFCVSRDPWWRHQKSPWRRINLHHAILVYRFSLKSDIVWSLKWQPQNFEGHECQVFCVSRDRWWRHQKFPWLSTTSYHAIHVCQISLQSDIVWWPKCRGQTSLKTK